MSKWTSRSSPLLRRASLGAWVALIVAASLVPRLPGPVRPFLFHGADKIGHAAAYAVLCLLLAWNVRSPARPVQLVGSALGAVLFGALVELVQPLTGRSCDLADVATNALGVGVALLLIALWGRVRRANG